MRSLHIGGIAGNVKLRGKLGKTLSCGCCDVRNLKPTYLTRLAKREIQDSRPDLSLLERVEEARGSEEQG